MTIVCTSDKKYLPLLIAMLNSVRENSPNTHVHCRLINVDPGPIKAYDNVSYFVDTTELDSRNNILINDWQDGPDEDDLRKLDRSKPSAFTTFRRVYSQVVSYCTNIKYDTLHTLMKQNTDEVYFPGMY